MNRLEVLLIGRGPQPALAAVAAALGDGGYAVVPFDDARAGLAHLRAGAGDAVLVDTTTARRPLELVAEIRRLTGKPILVLHSRDHSDLVLKALRQGAHDYVEVDPVTGSVHADELRARLGAAIQLAAHREPAREVIRVGDVRIHPADHAVWRGDRTVDLSRTEFQLLVQLGANPGICLHHDDLLRSVWSERQSGRVHYLRTYMSRLRKKLGWGGPGSGTPYIQSVRGEGYRLLIPQYARAS